MIIGKTYTDKDKYNRHVIDVTPNLVMYIGWGDNDTIMRSYTLRYYFYENKLDIETFKEIHDI